MISAFYVGEYSAKPAETPYFSSVSEGFVVQITDGAFERAKTDIVSRFMPHPLPEALTAVLQLDRTAALAAAFVIGTHHADVLRWVSKIICAGASAEPHPSPRKGNGAARRGRKANGHRKPRNDAGDRYLTRRRAQRDEDDSNLLAAMRRNTEATIGELATVVGKSRTSIVSGLHRLRGVGLAESIEGKWRLVEEPAPREPPAKWTAPLSASQRAHAHA